VEFFEILDIKSSISKICIYYYTAKAFAVFHHLPSHSQEEGVLFMYLNWSCT